MVIFINACVKIINQIGSLAIAGGGAIVGVSPCWVDDADAVSGQNRTNLTREKWLQPKETVAVQREN